MLSIETGYLGRSGNRRCIPKTFDPFSNCVALVALAVRFAAGKVPCFWLFTGLGTTGGQPRDAVVAEKALTLVFNSRFHTSRQGWLVT